MQILEELKRRQVIRVGLAYLAASWLLIQVLETLLPIYDVDDSWLRLIVVLLAIGFVPAIILAWVFDWTPQGIRKDDPDRVEGAADRRATRTFDRIIIVVLTLAVVLFAIDRFVLGPPRDSLLRAEQIALADTDNASRGGPWIAVLPFLVERNDVDQLSFSDGLTRQVISLLADVDDVGVVSSDASFAYRDRQRPIIEIGRVLSVTHILDGRVSRAADQIRITAELVAANTGEVVWSGTFDESLALQTVFEIQDRIAENVAQHLEASFAGTSNGARNGPASLEAWDLYNIGSYHLHRLIQSGRNIPDEELETIFRLAIENFEAAINASPNWAAPRAELGQLYHFVWNARRGDDLLALSKRHLTDALRIDESNGLAHSSLAYIAEVEGDYVGALLGFNRALELGAPEAHWGRAHLYRLLGDHELAIPEFQKAVEVDPLVLPLRYQLYETYYCAGRYDDMIRNIEAFFPPESGEIAQRIMLANAYAHSGQLQRALEMAEDISSQIDSDAPVASVLHLAGETERAHRAVTSSTHTAPFVVLNVIPGAVLAGEEELALTMLEDAARSAAELSAQERRSWLWNMRCIPELEPLHDTRRYQAILNDLGLPN